MTGISFSQVVPKGLRAISSSKARFIALQGMRQLGDDIVKALDDKCEAQGWVDGIKFKNNIILPKGNTFSFTVNTDDKFFNILDHGTRQHRIEPSPKGRRSRAGQMSKKLGVVSVGHPGHAGALEVLPGVYRFAAVIPARAGKHYYELMRDVWETEATERMQNIQLAILDYMADPNSKPNYKAGSSEFYNRMKDSVIGKKREPRAITSTWNLKDQSSWEKPK